MPTRVLIVDDEDALLEAAGSYLASLGYVIDRASEREEAEALLATRRYAAVVSDLRLTETHGAEGLEVLSFAKLQCPSVVTVLVTGHHAGSARAAAQAHGIDAFLAKPLRLTELAALLAGQLRVAP